MICRTIVRRLVRSLLLLRSASVRDLMHAKRIQINCLTKQWIIKICMGFDCNQLCRPKNVLGTPIACTPCTEPKRKKIRLFEPSIFTTLLPLNVNCETIADAEQNDCDFFFHWKEPKNRETFMKNEKWTASRLYCDWFIVVSSCLCLLCINHLHRIEGIPCYSLISDFRPKNRPTLECISSKITHRFVFSSSKWYFFGSMKTNRVDDKSTNTISQLDSCTWMLATREKMTHVGSTSVVAVLSEHISNMYMNILSQFFFSLQSFVDVECIKWVERRWYWKCIYCY